MNPKIVKHLKKITNLEIKELSHWLIFEKKENLSYNQKQKIIEKYTHQSFEKRKKYVYFWNQIRHSFIGFMSYCLMLNCLHFGKY